MYTVGKLPGQGISVGKLPGQGISVGKLPGLFVGTLQVPPKTPICRNFAYASLKAKLKTFVETIPVVAHQD